MRGGRFELPQARCHQPSHAGGTDRGRRRRHDGGVGGITGGRPRCVAAVQVRSQRRVVEGHDRVAQPAEQRTRHVVVAVGTTTVRRARANAAAAAAAAAAAGAGGSQRLQLLHGARVRRLGAPHQRQPQLRVVGRAAHRAAEHAQRARRVAQRALIEPPVAQPQPRVPGRLARGALVQRRQCGRVGRQGGGAQRGSGGGAVATTATTAPSGRVAGGLTGGGGGRRQLVRGGRSGGRRCQLAARLGVEVRVPRGGQRLPPRGAVCVRRGGSSRVASGGGCGCGCVERLPRGRDRLLVVRPHAHARARRLVRAHGRLNGAVARGAAARGGGGGRLGALELDVRRQQAAVGVGQRQRQPAPVRRAQRRDGRGQVRLELQLRGVQARVVVPPPPRALLVVVVIVVLLV